MPNLKLTQNHFMSFFEISWEPLGNPPQCHPIPKKFKALIKGRDYKTIGFKSGGIPLHSWFSPPRSTFWGCVFWYAFLSPRWVPTTRELQPTWHPSFFPLGFGAFFQKKKHGWPARNSEGHSEGSQVCLWETDNKQCWLYNLLWRCLPGHTMLKDLVNEGTNHEKPFWQACFLDCQTQWVRCMYKYIYIPYSQHTHIIG